MGFTGCVTQPASARGRILSDVPHPYNRKQLPAWRGRLLPPVGGSLGRIVKQRCKTVIRLHINLPFRLFPFYFPAPGRKGSGSSSWLARPKLGAGNLTSFQGLKTPARRLYSFSHTCSVLVSLHTPQDRRRTFSRYTLQPVPLLF